ncbi:MAG: hypothetical protein R6U04_04300 [Bacteroidales bacterium]
MRYLPGTSFFCFRDKKIVYEEVQYNSPDEINSYRVVEHLTT